MNLLVDGIMVVGAFMGIFFFLLILSKRRKCSSDYILSTFFLLMGLTVFLRHAEIFNREFEYPYPWLIKISTPLILLQGLTLWIYIKSLTIPHFRFKLADLLHLIPFIVAVGILYDKVYSLPTTQRVTIEATSSYEITSVVVLMALSNIGYYLWSLHLLSQYKKKVEGGLSSFKIGNLSWLRFFLVASTLTVGILGLFNYADYLYDMVNNSLLEKVAFACSSIYIVVVGFYGMRHSNILGDVPEEVGANTLATESGPKLLHEQSSAKVTDEEKKFIVTLLGYMESHRPYTEQELTIAVLSAQLNVSSEYLSFIINGRLNKNFFEFVNSYRIGEFKQMCARKDYRKYTLSAMAFECGFNSRATFNRVFKKSEGISPSDYLAVLEEKSLTKSLTIGGGALAI